MYLCSFKRIQSYFERPFSVLRTCIVLLRVANIDQQRINIY